MLKVEDDRLVLIAVFQGKRNSNAGMLGIVTCVFIAMILCQYLQGNTTGSRKDNTQQAALNDLLISWEIDRF